MLKITYLDINVWSAEYVVIIITLLFGNYRTAHRSLLDL